MKTRYIDHWRHTLQHSKKLEFYISFKNNFAPSIYLDITRKNCNRKTLVKLRIGNHKLGIETGRYDNTPRCERLCSLCDTKWMRSKMKSTFSFAVPSIQQLEMLFIKKIVNRIPNVNQLQLSDLIFDLMNCNDDIINWTCNLLSLFPHVLIWETNFYPVYNLFLIILISWFALAILYYYTVMQIKLVVGFPQDLQKFQLVLRRSSSNGCVFGDQKHVYGSPIRKAKVRFQAN